MTRYAATRLLCRRDLIEQLPPDGMFAVDIRPRDGEPFSVAMTRRQFERDFANLLATRSWAAGGYSYSVFPKRARAYIIEGAGPEAKHRPVSEEASRESAPRFHPDVEALRAHIEAIGGLSQSPCRRGERHRYLEVLCRAFPDTRFWALGPANPVLVNGLGCASLLDRVFVGGSWWIHDARAEVLAVLEDGLIKTIRLTHTGARSFFPLLDLMSCNLRSLLAAYAGLWTFPGPARVPTDLEELDARLELRRRLASAQLDLIAPMRPAEGGDAVPARPTAA